VVDLEPMLKLLLDLIDGCPREVLFLEGFLPGNVILKFDAQLPSWFDSSRAHIAHIPVKNSL
jgi:hypothetical protein